MAEQLFYKRGARREERNKIKRKLRSETWLFVCEGSKTEPNYIRSLVKHANNLSSESKLKIKVVGEGKSTRALIKSVDDLLSEIEDVKRNSDIPFGKIFVLFDKDSFREDDFDNAINMAVSREYIPIWSNECFELWYILHYEYLDSNIGREAYNEKLSKLLGVKSYKDHKSIDVFSIIHSPDRIKNALKNSERLSNDSCHESSNAKRVPCTQMFKLIQELENRLKIELSTL